MDPTYEIKEQEFTFTLMLFFLYNNKNTISKIDVERFLVIHQLHGSINLSVFITRKTSLTAVVDFFISSCKVFTSSFFSRP
jgi:hypothetical protein